MFPLEVRIGRPIALAFLRPQPLGPTPERRETSIGFLVANDFRRSGAVDEDSETARLALRWRERLRPDGTDAWLEVPFVARGGGMLDSAIDAWHRNILGWEDPVRSQTDRYRSRVNLAGQYRFGSAAGLGDVSAGVGLPRPGFTARLAIKLPTGNAARLLGSGGVDLALSAERQWRFRRRWTAGAMLGLTYQGSATAITRARSWVDSACLYVGYQPNDSDTWIIQWVSEASAMRSGVPAVDSTYRTLAFGYRRRTGPRSYTELTLVEDRDLFSGQAPWLANQGPDVAFGVRFIWR